MEQGAVVKALAQYKLALQTESGNNQAHSCIAAFHTNRAVKEKRVEQVEIEAHKPANSVILLFAGFSQVEFNVFYRRDERSSVACRRIHRRAA